MNRFDIELGRVMRQNREKKGIQQRQVADRLKVSEVSVHYWETGKRQINASTLTRYCDAIGVKVQSLFDEMDGMQA